MVHVTHDGDDGRTRQGCSGFVLGINFNLLDRGVDLTFTFGAFLDLKLHTILGANLDGIRNVVNGLVNVRERRLP